MITTATLVKKGTLIIPSDVQVQIKAKIRMPKFEPTSPNNVVSEQIETLIIDVVIIPYKLNRDFYLGIFLSKHVISSQKPKTTELLNLISHEMRSPLVAIEGLIRLFITKAHLEIKHPNLDPLIDGYLVKANIFLRNLLDACQLILEMSR